MHGYPPWGYPMPPPYFSSPGYSESRKSEDPVRQARRWEKFLKEERKELKKDEKKDEKKHRSFSFIEAFMLTTILSIPIGMITSLLAVQGLTMWVGAMSRALNIK